MIQKNLITLPVDLRPHTGIEESDVTHGDIRAAKDAQERGAQLLSAGSADLLGQMHVPTVPIDHPLSFDEKSVRIISVKQAAAHGDLRGIWRKKDRVVSDIGTAEQDGTFLQAKSHLPTQFQGLGKEDA